MTTADEERIDVLVADDHPLYVDGLRRVIEAEPDLRLVGFAQDGHEVRRLALKLAPDVIVMDVQMPSISGVEATRHIKLESPHVAVLMLTMFDDDESVFAAMRAGASGYLLKGAGAADIAAGIRAVARGGAVFGPTVAQRIIRYFAEPGTSPQLFPELTDREREVLEQLSKGLPNAAIARVLFLSEKTVRNYVSNIFSKLHFADRAEAIVRAREAGLGGGQG